MKDGLELIFSGEVKQYRVIFITENPRSFLPFPRRRKGTPLTRLAQHVVARPEVKVSNMNTPTRVIRRREEGEEINIFLHQQLGKVASL